MIKQYSIFSLSFLCLNYTKFCIEIFILSSPGKKEEKVWFECTLKQINKCGAQWPQCRDHAHTVCSAPYHPHLLLLRLHGCISQALMGFSAMRSRAWHALNNGRQMTSQLHLMMASVAAAAFFDVEEYKGSVIHYGCTGGPRSNESHFVQFKRLSERNAHA